MINNEKISTHTLRGERDLPQFVYKYRISPISTHTLRGERDGGCGPLPDTVVISTHTLRGERDQNVDIPPSQKFLFQLTRSVGSVTL